MCSAWSAAVLHFAPPQGTGHGVSAGSAPGDKMQADTSRNPNWTGNASSIQGVGPDSRSDAVRDKIAQDEIDREQRNKGDRAESGLAPGNVIS